MSAISDFLPRHAKTGDIVLSENVLESPEWLPCDGRTYLKSAYPRLYDVLKNKYPVNGSGTVLTHDVSDIQDNLTTGNIYKVRYYKNRHYFSTLFSSNSNRLFVSEDSFINNDELINFGSYNYDWAIGNDIIVRSGSNQSVSRHNYLTGELIDSTSIPNTASGKSIEFGNNTFMAISPGEYYVWKSIDNGATWEAKSITPGSTNNFPSIIRHMTGSNWLIFNVNTTSPQLRVSTNNGDTWSNVSLSGIGSYGVVDAVYGNGIYMILYTEGNNLYCRTSTNLTTWSAARLIKTGNAAPSIGAISPIYANGAWYVLNGAQPATQTFHKSVNNGVSWTQQSRIVSSYPIFHLEERDGGLLALATSATSFSTSNNFGNAIYVYKSPNYENWYPYRLPATVNYNKAIEIRNDTAVAITNSAAISIKTPAIGAGTTTNKRLDMMMNSIAKTASGPWVVVGPGGRIRSATTPTGTWTNRTSGTTENINDIAAHPTSTMYVIVGDNGYLRSSTNGTSWTNRTSGTTENILRVKYRNGKWIAVCTGGIILESSNGTSWTVNNNLKAAFPAVTAISDFDYNPDSGEWIFLAGGGGHRLFRTNDLINFDDYINAQSGVPSIVSIAYYDGMWYGAQVLSSALSVSNDGINWKLSNSTVGSANSFIKVIDGDLISYGGSTTTTLQLFKNWDSENTFRTPVNPFGDEAFSSWDIPYIKT